MPIHLTKPEDADVGHGWYPLADGLEVTLPLVDRAHKLDDGTHLFARLTYAGALAAAELLGGRLPTRDEVRLLHAVGLQLEPVTMPITGELAGSEKHDREVWFRLASQGWDGGRPVSGAGKHWIAGAPPGRAYLAGWWTSKLERYTPPPGKTGHRSGPGFVQDGATSGPGPHGDQHHDYGTTTILVRRVVR